MTEDFTPRPAHLDVTMYWLRAQRSRIVTQEYWENKVLAYCRRAAERAGMKLEVISPDDVIVAGSPDATTVYVSGTAVDSKTAFFHTKLMTWPDSVGDAWRVLSVSATLEAAGMHITVPPSQNISTNDKLLTLFRYGQLGVKWLPTTRVSTRQFGWLSVADLGMEYPVIVKGANWGGGHGVMRATDRRELEVILQLAGAGELTMVIQPWLGSSVTDYRIYCVNGVPTQATTRKPTGTSLTGNLFQGGAAAVIEVPDELVEPATAIAQALGLAYCCVDFLEAEGEFWFSEIEVDGGTRLSEELADLRFGAYRNAFDAFAQGDSERASARTS